MDGIRGKMHSRSQRGAFRKRFSRVRNLPRADSSEGPNELPLQSPGVRLVGQWVLLKVNLPWFIWALL